MAGKQNEGGMLSKAKADNETGPVKETPTTNEGGTGTAADPIKVTIGQPDSATQTQTKPSMQDLYAKGFDPALAPATEVPGMTGAGSAAGAYTGGSGLGGKTVINSNPTLPGGGTGTIDSEGYEVTEGELSDDAKATKILARETALDSPLMQRAQQEGMLTAARRGLQNSSIAAGASMGAMVDRATPVVLQEAQSMTSMELANLEETNKAKAFTAASKNAASLTAAQLKSQEGQTLAGIKSTESIASAQLTSQEKQAAAQIASSEAMFSAQQKNQMAQFNAEWANRAGMLKAELNQQAGQFNASQQNAINSQIMALNTELNAQYLRGTQALDLATIQGQFQTLITNNAVAGELFSGYMSTIGQIMANPDMDPGRVANMIQIQQNMLQQGLTFIGNINNADWSKFLPGGGAAANTPVPPTPTQWAA